MKKGLFSLIHSAAFIPRPLGRGKITPPSVSTLRQTSGFRPRLYGGLILVLALLANISGCVPLIVGGAVGVLGGYAVSKDTVQGDTDRPYDKLWNAALTVSRIRGTIEQENQLKGYIELKADSSRVWIKLIRLTRATTRLKVSSRKHRLPNLELAQDIFVKITEEVK